MKKSIIILIGAVLLSLASNAQNTSFTIRGNMSIGTNYQSLDYSGQQLRYSPGGGSGIEFGIDQKLAREFSLRASIGFQLNLALQSEQSFGSNSYSNKSSFTFSRGFFSLGAVKGIPLSGKSVTHFLIGAGAQYHLPGPLERTENDSFRGRINYSSSFGAYMEAGILIRINKKASLEPTLRYRSLSFTASEFLHTSADETDEDLIDMSANGIEIGVTYVKRLGR